MRSAGLKSLKRLLEHSEFLSYLHESGNALVQLLAFVGGGNLHAYARLVLWYHRVVESGNVDSLLLHLCRKYLGKPCVIQHYCTDGALGRLDVEACGNHLVPEVVDILDKLVVECIAFLKNAEYLEAGTYDARSQGVLKEIRAAPLPEKIDDFLASCGESAHRATEGLSERAGVDVNPAVGAGELAYAVACCSHDSCGV